MLVFRGVSGCTKELFTTTTPLGTTISLAGTFEDNFSLFPRWDLLVSWMVSFDEGLD